MENHAGLYMAVRSAPDPPPEHDIMIADPTQKCKRCGRQTNRHSAARMNAVLVMDINKSTNTGYRHKSRQEDTSKKNHMDGLRAVRRALFCAGGP